MDLPSSAKQLQKYFLSNFQNIKRSMPHYIHREKKSSKIIVTSVLNLCICLSVTQTLEMINNLQQLHICIISI